jgi:uncharacterized OB-fold protein
MSSYAATSEYGGVVAPPAMLEVWTMGRFRADGSTDTGELLGMEQLNTAGFTAVVATNLEQEYLRYLRPGDLITQRVFLEDVSDEKRTALGAGHFLDYRYEFCDQRGTRVGRMRFPDPEVPSDQAGRGTQRAAVKPAHPRPSVTRDSTPSSGRACSSCRSSFAAAPAVGICTIPRSDVPAMPLLEWAPQPVSGRGVVHSYVIVHEPQLPGFSYPLPVALVELEEGVRLIGNLHRLTPDAVRIGMPVEVQFEEVEPGYVLYIFRQRAG